MTVISVEIRRRIKSDNAFKNKRGIPASFEYRKDRDAWYVLLRAALRQRAEPAKCFVRIEIHSFRNRLLDKANLVGGSKAIPDCLIRLGYLYDDGPKYFDAEYLQVQCPRVLERTVVVIHPPTLL